LKKLIIQYYYIEMNLNVYRAKTYLRQDPENRLYNGKIYSCYDFLGQALKDLDSRAYIVEELRRSGYEIDIVENREWYNDGHKYGYEAYFLIKSKIKKNSLVHQGGDILGSDNIGQYVTRRKSSVFWQTFDPYKIYRIIAFDPKFGLLYLCDAKDKYGNDIANLAEYDYNYPKEIKMVAEDEDLPIKEPTRKTNLIICYADDGFRLY